VLRDEIRRQSKQSALVRLACLATIALVAHLHAETLTDLLAQGDAGKSLRPLAETLGREVARSLPIVSASPGIRYEYDFGSNTYVRRVSLGGEAFVEHADPVGRGHLNLGLIYQHVRFDRFGGQDLHDLSDTHPFASAGGAALFRINRRDLDVEINEATLGAIYGISDRLDIGLSVPLMGSSLDLRDDLTQFKPRFKRFPEGATGSDFGIGDIVVRPKFTIVATSSIRASAGLLFRIPSGSKDNFQGVGSPELAPGLFVSSVGRTLGRSLVLRGHANLSMLFDTDDVNQSEGRWAAAADLSFGERAIGAIALIGRHAVGRIFDQDSIAFERCLSGAKSCESGTGTYGSRPLFGLNGARPDYVDLSIGGRVVVWRDSVIAFANVLIPLLKEGLVAEPVPVVGIEVAL
jgi:hypothetical protein